MVLSGAMCRMLMVQLMPLPPNHLLLHYNPECLACCCQLTRVVQNRPLNECFSVIDLRNSIPAVICGTVKSSVLDMAQTAGKLFRGGGE